MDNYFRAQLAERRKHPRTDMLSLMGNGEDEDGYRLSDDEVVQHCRFLLPGGIETTWRQTANLIMSLMLHPDQYEAVVADPSLIDSAVEEALRWQPSGFVVPRIVARDTRVANMDMPAGAQICTIQGIANRDPAVFADAHVFNIRRHPNPHLTFHTGVHFCMGQNLARFALRETLRKLIEELPGLRLACNPTEIGTRGFGVRNPTHLPLTAVL
jgi:pimeloyl-[acyl-carrier protein] synthase